MARRRRGSKGPIHDSGYKLLFSHAEMVADLLRGFVGEAWVGQLDLGSLERVSGSYVSDDLRERHDDIVWRARWGVEWLYVYLLLEFQSTVDRYMAARVMTYEGLLYQDLERSGRLPADGRLPPVLALVLYRGVERWTAAQEIGELVQPVPGGLERYRPSLRYLLIDEGRYRDEELAPLHNLAAALFRLENSRTPEQVLRVLEALLEWLKTPEQARLRRSFAIWLRRVLLPERLPGVELPRVDELQEVKQMLEERKVPWTEQWKQQGEVVMLTQLLELKFGPLDEPARERLRKADADTLLLWGRRLLAAGSLAEIFSS